MLLLTAAQTIAQDQTAIAPPPDLTKEIDFERKGEYYLGSTGAKGWMFVNKRFMTDEARQILITKVEPGSPGDGILEVGDVILGVNGEYFKSDARVCLGLAINEAVTRENKGVLKIIRWRPVKGSPARKGKEKAVELKLKIMGAYSDTAPYHCPKSEKIREDALEALVKRDDWGKFGLKALAFLATGEEKYVKLVRDFIHEAKWAKPDIKISVESGGLVSWGVGYHNLVLTEYYLATGDKYVLPAIREYAVKTAMGQSAAGTWGHGFAWTSKNDGKLHGRCVGYGALNQAGLPCFVSLILAKKCGIKHAEIDDAIARSNRFFKKFIGNGSIGYGFHRPSLEIHCNGRNGMSGNGKNGIAAVAFSLLAEREGMRFFSKMAASLYKTCEYGHSGNCYSYFWDPLGANCAGPKTAAAFHKQLRWYYALTRMADGSFVNQPLGGHYGRCVLDPTVAQVLMACLPRRAIHLTGKGQDRKGWIDAKEVEETIAAGKWRFADTAHISARELIGQLDSWSPIAREWIAKALAEKEGNFIPQLMAMAKSDKPEARAGACAALGYQGERAADAVPVLSKSLTDKESIVCIAAGYALARLEKTARKAVPDMLSAIAFSKEKGLMRPIQQALAYSLGYPGGRSAPLYFKGLLPTLAEDGDPLKDVDRKLLYAFVDEISKDPSARVRGCGVYVFTHFTRKDVAVKAQAIYDCSRELAPNYAMFGDLPRNFGLEVMARFRIEEGLALCFQTLDLSMWGQGRRIENRLRILQTYGGAARSVLPDVKDLRWKVKSGEHRELLEQTIALIEKDKDPAETVGLAVLVDQEMVEEKVSKAKTTKERVRVCRELMTKYPDNTFLRTACLRRLAGLLKADAFDELLAAIGRSNPQAGIGRLGGEKTIPQLIDHLSKTDSKQLRKAAERSLVAACRRPDNVEGPVGAVIAAMADADEKTRVSLLGVLGRIGGNKALTSLADAAGDDNSRVRQATFEALGTSADPKATDTLLDLAGKNANRRIKGEALAACLRRVMNERVPSRKGLAVLAKIMTLDGSGKVTRMALAELPWSPSIAALRLAQSRLAEKGLSEPAAQAAVAIIQAMDVKDDHQRRAAVAAMKEVTKVTTNEETAAAAKALLAKLGQ